jgi:peptidoglycan/LPS O-acetylase OafA/YrhL
VYLVSILLIQLIALSEWKLWSWLDWPVMRFLGRISYPLYLYHYVAFVAATNATRGYSMKVRLLAGLCATLLTASASYFFVEKPFLKLKNRVNHAA